ncbi:hypothetical protein [Rhizobium mesosinicum]|uniref:Uncharacterized protein n=1 Tax=Rhizobium mesosinicum TaxID=335017 RepID=A0ABS7GY81_9HYPH|nr:hypothetical protein [Rhizobium mesosinicum]MBW9054948.1 hypothetical protein [Rhizobium mesosinicum]
MPGWLAKFIGGLSSKAKFVELPSDAEANLAAHPQVNLQPKSIIDGPVTLPLWLDFPPHHGEPRTYDGVFWEVEPRGEYLYYLAGAFQKNYKGLLRFGTAPLEIRAERNFETDVIRASLQDGDRAQAEARSSMPWQGMTVVDACHLLLTEARASGSESWIGAFKGTSPDVLEGRSRLRFGLQSQTREPLLEVKYERFYPATADGGEPFLFEVKTQCRLPDVPVDDIITLHEEVAAAYRDVPSTHISGATRM